MADFNLHRWFKNQYLQENDDPKIGDELEAGLDGTGVAENEETQDTASLAAKAINNAIMSVDDTMHYGDFAKAVATILKDEYGTHNFGKFMNILHSELGINEGLIKEFGEYKDAQDELNKELSKEFGGVSPYISLGMYAGGRPDSDPLKGKGYGDITFRINEELPDQEWNEVLKWVKSKGWEVTDESNWYDYEPGERYFYPKIKFQFNVADFPPTNS